MGRTLTVLLVSVWLIATANMLPCAGDCTACGRDASLCGPRCLLAVFESLGVHSTIDEAKTLCSYDATAGTTMLGLASAARAKGLQAIAYKIGLADVAKAHNPVIALLWGDHYVVVTPAEDGWLVVTDPPAGPVRVQTADFRDAYAGLALMVGAASLQFPRPKDEGPDLRLSTYTWNFGAPYAGEQATCVITCRNAGSTPLTITQVGESSSSVRVAAYPHSLAPGSDGEMKLVLDTTRLSNRVVKTLHISSNDPITPEVRLQINGYVRSKSLRRSPRELAFGDVHRLDRSVLELSIPSSSDEPVKVSAVRCDSPYIAAAIATAVPADRPGAVVRVTLSPGAPIGAFATKLIIESDHPFEPKAEVPVTAVIKGNIDLDRDMFFLGLAKQGKGSSCNVTVSTVSKDPLKIGKIDNPLDCVTVEVKPKTEGKEYILTATLKPDAPLGHIKGEVTVHTNDPDQPEIKVPVYAYVEK